MRKLSTIGVILAILAIGFVTSGCGSSEVKRAKAYKNRQSDFRLASRIRSAAAPSRIICPCKANEMLTQMEEDALPVGNVYVATDEAGRLECWDGPGIDERGKVLRLAEEKDLRRPRAPMPGACENNPQSQGIAQPETPRPRVEKHEEPENLPDLSQKKILPDLSQRPCGEK